MRRAIVILCLLLSACAPVTSVGGGRSSLTPLATPSRTPLARWTPLPSPSGAPSSRPSPKAAIPTPQPATWEKQFDNHGNADIAWDIVETPTGDFVIVGTTGPTPCQLGCNWDGWVIRINARGEIIWTRQVGGNGADLLTSVILRGDDCLVTGSKYVFPLARQAWLLDIAPNGNVVWERTLGGNQDDSATEIIGTADGGLLLIGQTASFGTHDGKSDVWLVKLNAQGEAVWTKTYDLGDDDMGTSIIPFQNDRFIITTVTCTANCGGLNQQGYAGYLVVDSAGNILKTQTFTEGPKNKLLKVRPTNDGGAVIVGATSMNEKFPSEDTWIVKLDADAETSWVKVFSSYGKYDGGFDIVQTSDGGYVVAAYSQVEQTPAMNFDNFWVVRLNSTGETLWSRLWGGPDNDDAYAVTLTSDGGFALAGFRNAVSWPLNAIPGPSDFYVIKIADADPREFLPDGTGSPPADLR